jgi:hypothetical protein
MGQTVALTGCLGNILVSGEDRQCSVQALDGTGIAHRTATPSIFDNRWTPSSISSTFPCAGPPCHEPSLGTAYFTLVSSDLRRAPAILLSWSMIFSVKNGQASNGSRHDSSMADDLQLVCFVKLPHGPSNLVAGEVEPARTDFLDIRCI